MYNFILGLVIGVVVSAVDEEDVKAVKDEYTKIETKFKRAIDAFNKD
jgi:hypothetical protein